MEICDKHNEELISVKIGQIKIWRCRSCQNEIEKQHDLNFAKADRLYLNAETKLQKAITGDWQWYHSLGGSLLRDRDIAIYTATKNIFSRRIDKLNEQVKNF